MKLKSKKTENFVQTKSLDEVEENEFYSCKYETN